MITRAGPQPRARSASALLAHYRVAALALAGLGAILAVDPTYHDVPLCPLHAATGWSCPLCGSLRAVYSIAHLQLRAALHYNALAVFALVPVACYVGLRTSRGRRGLPAPALSRAAWTLLAGGALAFAVLRNLPVGHRLGLA